MEATMAILAGSGVLLFVIFAGAVVVLLVAVSGASLLHGLSCLLNGLRDRVRRRSTPAATGTGCGEDAAAPGSALAAGNPQ